MYNVDRKREYLITISNENSRKAGKSLFNRIEDVELYYSQDIADLKANDLKHALGMMHYLSFATLRTDLSLLKDYIYWSNNNISPNDYNAIKVINAKDIDISEAICEELFKDEDELKASLSFWSASEGYFESPIACLSWIGLDIKQILNLKNEDVYIENGTMFVRIPDRTIQIESDYIYEVLLNYSKTKSATRKHRSDWVVFADDIGYFIKNFIPSSKFAGRRMTPLLVRRKITKCNLTLPDGLKKITLNNILLSGRLNRIMLEKQKTGALSDSMFVNEFNKKEQRYINDIKRIYEYYEQVFIE